MATMRTTMMIAMASFCRTILQEKTIDQKPWKLSNSFTLLCSLLMSIVDDTYAASISPVNILSGITVAPSEVSRDVEESHAETEDFWMEDNRSAP